MSDVDTTSHAHAANKPGRTPPRTTPKPPMTIGGGHIVLRRDAKSERLTLIGHRPFEHGSLKEATEQAQALADKHGGTFAVLAQVGTVTMPERPKGPATTAPAGKPSTLVPAPTIAPEPAPALAKASQRVEVVRARRPTIGIRRTV